MKNNRIKIERVNHDFTICKIQDASRVNLSSQFVFLGKTDEELSLVCLTEDVPDNAYIKDDGWKAFRIQGELDFSLIGILSAITGVMAENQIGVFAISTYNTDYVLVRSENYEKALKVLEESGYILVK